MISTPLQSVGVLLIAGALSFFLGAALPTRRVYLEPDPDKRAAIITSRRGYWILSHLLFLTGVILTVIGLAALRNAFEAQTARILVNIGLVAAALGALVWAYIVIAFRLIMSPEEYVRTNKGAWTFPVYTLLTLGALMLFAVALVLVGYPMWVGVTTLGLSALILIAFLIQRDSIPALYYLVSLILGVGLLL